MNPYQKLLDRKRKWSPVQTTAGKLAEGAEETIDMYERGEISREDLYQSILDLDVVYRSTDQKSVESEVE